MPTIRSAIPVCYVRDLDAAQAFYQLLGLTERRRGGSTEGGYRFLGSGDCTVLLAWIDPYPVAAPLPLGLYLWSTDVAAIQADLSAAGVPNEHVGYPDHAPGGELRTTDPDGNVVVIGQQVPNGSTVASASGSAGFSILKEAAARAAAAGVGLSACQIGEKGGVACTRAAEVKLADPWGASVWGCLSHAEEALFNARSAFIATDDGQGLSNWLGQRQQGTTPPS